MSATLVRSTDHERVVSSLLSSSNLLLKTVHLPRHWSSRKGMVLRQAEKRGVYSLGREQHVRAKERRIEKRYLSPELELPSSGRTKPVPEEEKKSHCSETPGAYATARRLPSRKISFRERYEPPGVEDKEKKVERKTRDLLILRDPGSIPSKV